MGGCAAHVNGAVHREEVTEYGDLQRQPRFKNKKALKLRALENCTVKPDWRHSFDGWLRGLDLNQRPLGYEPNELPDCSTPRLKLSTISRSGSLVGCVCMLES
jgi:hypothetical protein